jgi:hypothetical protein
MAADSKRNNVASYAIFTLREMLALCWQGQLEKVHVADRERDVRILP